jgi:hypothetical protein
LSKAPGVSENWGKGIFRCPWCDGHEHADQPPGPPGSPDNVPSAVREMSTPNSDIIAPVTGTDTPEFRAATDKKHYLPCLSLQTPGSRDESPPDAMERISPERINTERSSELSAL